MLLPHLQKERASADRASLRDPGDQDRSSGGSRRSSRSARNSLERSSKHEKEAVEHKEEGEVEDDQPDAKRLRLNPDTSTSPLALPDTEAISDFGESDEDILNKDDTNFSDDEKTEGERDKDVPSRSSSRKSSHENAESEEVKSAKKDSDLLEGISDEDLDVSDEEDAKLTKAKVADVLGVDWSQMLQPCSTEVKVRSEKGSLADHWSPLSIFKRIGVSKTLLGSEEEYQKFLNNLNQDVSGKKQTDCYRA